MNSIVLDPQKYEFEKSHALELEIRGDTSYLNIALLVDEAVLFQQAYSLNRQLPCRNYSFTIEGKPCFISIWGGTPKSANINVVVDNTCVLHWG
ncbi:MAG: hypothetical protein K8I82_10560 [Anaerolineae bacterium]|jgi:hypothetical protein|nr:hypothetical protein [Anaerolineae bacterium]